MMKKQFLLLSLILMTFCLFGQKSPDDIVNDFFTTYSQNKPDKALDDLYSNTPWLDSKDDAVVKIKTQFRDLKQLVGEYNGYELLTKKELGGCFELRYYIVKYDRQPFRFKFEFYKPKDKWIIYSFGYDYDLDDDLEQAAKFDLLNTD